ncbi:MAG: HAD family phosphatase [Acidobacteria bacterium]|nr:MAG: HAD family phosphatase [Acidobacteriota bacterium]
MKQYAEIPGIGVIREEYQQDFVDLEASGDGSWRVGQDGVWRIVAPLDRKVEFVVFEDKTLGLVKSSLGPHAYYPLLEDTFSPPAEAVLMDLDGTSVRSEHFWMWIIEQSIARLKRDPGFRLAPEDEPHVSGHSVSEHLQYCIDKYAPGGSLEEARRHYFEKTSFEMKEISHGRGRYDAFHPSPGLKEFLMELKGRGIKIGLVTSGLYEKAWPEILSAFKTLNMGDPLNFYDAIITAGHRLTKGQTGTLGELAPKPHPWLYAETAYVGLGVDRSRRHKVIGLEDSGAGVVSIRLAGFAAIGISDGNIERSGVRPLLRAYCRSLLDALPLILG